MNDQTQKSRFRQTILGTCCIPWSVEGDLDEEIFSSSIRTLIDRGLRDLYVFGTAGEGYAVTESQFDQVVGVFSQTLTSFELEPMVGVISLSLATVIERIERCAERGVRMFQISLPSWGVLTDIELQRFFAETCGRFPELDFLHYNLSRAKRLVTPDEYADLATRYPNLIATKNAGAAPATIEALLTKTPELCHFFTEPGYAIASMHGPCGFLISVATINPRLAREFFEAGVRQDSETVQRLADELAAVVSYLEVALGDTRIDGAYDKCLIKMLEPDFPLRLLPPYDGAEASEFGRFVNLVRDHQPHWLT